MRASPLVRGFAVITVLVALICVFFAEENWRGRRDWEQYRRGLVARGVQLDWQKDIPPPVPDDQNFAMTPFLAPLFKTNPKPRQAGQPPWSDAEGRDRAMNFAATLATTDRTGALHLPGFTGQLTDLTAPLAALRNQTNQAAITELAASFTNRAQAAAEILAALETYRPVLEEIHSASRLPYARFNVEYDTEDPMSILIPHYMVLTRFGRALEVRASAELALGKSAAAGGDAKLICFLSETIRPEPFAIGVPVRGRLVGQTAQIVWEGLAGRNWPDQQLLEFQNAFGAFAFFNDLAKSLDFERGVFGDVTFRMIRRNKNILRDWIHYGDGESLTYLLAGPTGWFYQEQLTLHRLMDQRVSNGFEPKSGHIDPLVVRQNQKALTNDLAGSSLWHHNGFAKLSLQNITKLFQRAALAQNLANQTVLACALERYRLRNGKYPEALAALTPQFLDHLPLDVCDGQPMKYRLRPDGRFVLYSVGWNQNDDAGETSPNPEGSDSNPDEGDWVWPAYPQP